MNAHLLARVCGDLAEECAANLAASEFDGLRVTASGAWVHFEGDADVVADFRSEVGPPWFAEVRVVLDADGDAPTTFDDCRTFGDLVNLADGADRGGLATADVDGDGRPA